jgi:hypothetical protein
MKKINFSFKSTISRTKSLFTKSKLAILKKLSPNTISRKENLKYSINDSKTKMQNSNEKYLSKKEKITQKCAPVIFIVHSKESPKNPVFTAVSISLVINSNQLHWGKSKNYKKTIFSIVSSILKKGVMKTKMTNRIKTPLKNLKKILDLMKNKIILNLKHKSLNLKRYKSQNLYQIM